MSEKKNLEAYQKKRDFRKTKEPEDSTSTEDYQNLFVIQKHDASQLHYDFRIQIDDALTSWAVPKGLSTAANEKRLAIRTEDHPLDYAKFEGVIPEDEYGGGTVMVWDIGRYEPLVDDDDKKSMQEALEGGSLKFRLHGEKIKGGYAMARIRDDEDEQWVIFKLDDEEADAPRNPVSSEPDSVLTGRSMEEIAEEEDDHE